MSGKEIIYWVNGQELTAKSESFLDMEEILLLAGKKAGITPGALDNCCFIKVHGTSMVGRVYRSLDDRITPQHGDEFVVLYRNMSNVADVFHRVIASQSPMIRAI